MNYNLNDMKENTSRDMKSAGVNKFVKRKNTKKILKTPTLLPQKHFAGI